MDDKKTEKILDWLWSPEEKRTVLALLRGRKVKKEIEEYERKKRLGREP